MGEPFLCCLKGIRPQITRIHTDFCYPRTSVNICEICGRIFIFCLKGILPQITRINTDFCFLKNICEYLRSAGEHSYAAWKVISHRLQINTDFNCISCICVNLRNLWENPFYAAWEVFAHWLRGLTQILVFSRTSVNICEICGRTFICCLKGNLPQITRINTDFS